MISIFLQQLIIYLIKRGISPMEYYDKTDYYNSNIEPIVHELKKECGTNNIPFFITIATKNTETGTHYESDMILASAQTHLTDNRISKMLLALNGVDTKLPDQVKKAKEILEEYISEKIKKETLPDIELTVDYLDDMHSLSNGALDITFCKEEAEPLWDSEYDI